MLIKSEYLHWTSDNVLQKIELCLTKGASKRTWLSRVKLIFFYKLPMLKPKNSVSIDFSCSGFSFYEHFNYQFIQNRKMCLSKNIFYQCFVGFLPCLGQLLL